MQSSNVSEESVATLLLSSPRPSCSLPQDAGSELSQQQELKEEQLPRVTEEGTFCQCFGTTCSSKVLKQQITACKGVSLHICTLEGTFSKERMQFVHGMVVPRCDALQRSCHCDGQGTEKVSWELFEAGGSVASHHAAWWLVFALTLSNSVSIIGVKA